MDRFQRWAKREHSAGRRLVVLAIEGTVFVAAIPALLAKASSAQDRWLNLPSFLYGRVNRLAALALIGPGACLPCGPPWSSSPWGGERRPP